MTTKDSEQTQASDFAARSFKTGTKIAGCYILKTLLYETPASVVWQAHDDLLNRDVSLHFLPDAVFADSRALTELREEVKVNRQLIHPNILRVYDLVEDVECAAISMDYVEAETLTALKGKKNGHYFSTADVRPWLAQICQAVEDAHRARLLHRDLTPHNILVRGNGSVVLTSFGISRSILDAIGRHRPGSPDPNLAYRSPQLLDGEQPSVSDDVYSFGALVYESLTSQPPFQSGDVLAKIRKATPPRMTEKRAELGLTGDTIPAQWEKTVAACLEKHTDARPADFAAIAAGMRLERAGTTDAAGTETRAEPVAKAETPAAAAPQAAAEPARERKREREPVPAASAKKPAPAAVERRRTEEPARPLSPFASMVEREEQTRKGRGAGVGLLVAAVLLIIAVVGILSLRTGDKEAEQRAAYQTPEMRTGESTQEVPEPTPGESTVTSTEEAATPAPAATPVTGSATLAEAQSALAEAQTIYERQRKEQQEAETAVEAARSTSEQQKQIAEQAEQAAQEVTTKLDEQKKALDKLRADAEEARKAAEEKAKAADAEQAKTASLEAELKEKQEAISKMQSESAKALEVVTQKEAALRELEKAAQAAAANRDRVSENVASMESSAKTQESTAAAQQAEAMRVQREQEQGELTRKAAEAQKAADDAARLAEQARQALREAERLRSESEAARKRAGGAPAPVRPGATPGGATLVPSPTEKVPGAPGAGAAAGVTTQTGGGIENSLGMRFVPVGEVLFSVWETRVKDYSAFASATGRGGGGGGWKSPGFKQAPDHAVVNVTWMDAIAFCQWLTEKEQGDGRLKPDQTYRLPTDVEWSAAVGLPNERGATPEERDMTVQGVFPWGTEWPPPAGSGNYTGEETGSDVAIKGYNDGFVWTAPVGSFKPNQYGLYDIGGNAWEWVMDWWNSKQTEKVLRGGSWYNGALKLSLFSSCRYRQSADGTTDNYGFRVVLSKVPRATRK